MLNGKTLRLVSGIVVAGVVLATSSVGAVTTLPKRPDTLTFSAPVSLPGVALAPGSYVFEFADPVDAWGVVRVLSTDRTQVYFTGFTKVVNRPASVARGFVSLAEAQPTVPRPIAVWWPNQGTAGHQFVRPMR